QPLFEHPLVVDDEPVPVLYPRRQKRHLVQRGFSLLISPRERITRHTSFRIPVPVRGLHGVAHVRERGQYVALPAGVRAVERRRRDERNLVALDRSDMWILHAG